MTNSNTVATKAYETLRATKSQDRAAWLAAALQLTAAAASQHENDETRAALLDRAESAEMNARRCR